MCVWQALEEAITEQHEQERSIESEMDAYRKDIVREQIRNEQLTAVVTKLEGESGFLHTQNQAMLNKQEKLQVSQPVVVMCPCRRQGIASAEMQFCW